MHGDNFAIKLSFNKLLKIKEDLINLKKFLKKINPCEFAKIIDKAYIISVLANRGRGRTPYIRKNLFQRNSGNTSRDRIR